jgi:hypothetical protein
MSTFDVSQTAQCRHCFDPLVTRVDHTGRYFVHSGTWLTRCVSRTATGKTATPAAVPVTQHDVRLAGA